MSLYEAQCQVQDFMMAAEQECPGTPVIPDFSVMQLRFSLMHEELQEFVLAVDRITIASYLYSDHDVLTQVADALADLMYVTLGTAVAFGIDIQPIFDAVHVSNMEKFGPGGHKRADGKWQKPPDWRAPDLRAILAGQMD